MNIVDRWLLILFLNIHKICNYIIFILVIIPLGLLVFIFIKIASLFGINKVSLLMGKLNIKINYDKTR